jgi:hypothetical protein
MLIGMNFYQFSATDLDTLVGVTAPSIDLTGGIGSLITSLVPYLVGAAGFALLIYIIIGGYQIMFSGGDPKGIAAGRSKVTNAIIGILIVFLAFGITMLVTNMLGLSSVNPFNGSSSSSVPCPICCPTCLPCGTPPDCGVCVGNACAL